MKIENPREKFLSNYEVYDYLKEILSKNNWGFTAEEHEYKNDKKWRKNDMENLEAITRDTLAYLKKSTPVEMQSPETITEMMRFLNTMELEKIEKLQILNNLPRNLVSLYAIVEECDSRFDEEKCNKLIEKIDALFPEEQSEEVEDAAMEDA
ncbi:hypothetical protein BABINDRAFT_35066 [Babjeviella inositovora NRRL Y-12698]|uniref:DNA-directed RNA polymerase III subunit RPC9 n=1 Tax=Babjeviella inositovora NRRL Y-12698 TaxID=984486 RepID=A0A1E3QSR8_9ASCO|nr:uncharacterized protein BABINDRAFT_35066 [Babjeviella inositovora NRRL Y-12698]ODQ80755.1 hypothetical protein BABINDRAFT_35066 [Babjeviella inositovora NRRL Y-12698]